MFRIFNNIKFNNTCIYLVLITFPMAGIASPPAIINTNLENQLDDDDSLFLVSKQIIDKMLELEKKGKINEMIDFMLDVKEEVEFHSECSISIKDQLKEVQKLAKEEGKGIPKEQIEKFKRLLKKREKKRNKIAFGIGFRSKKNQEEKEEKQEKEEIELPVRMAFGITVTLCGLFIWFLPHPAAKASGKWMIGIGVGYITDSGLDKLQENQDERKNKSGKLEFTTMDQKDPKERKNKNRK